MGLLLQQVLDRAGRRRELDGERHPAVVTDDDVLHEIERHDVATQVGVLHHAKRVEDLGNGRKGHGSILLAFGLEPWPLGPGGTPRALERPSPKDAGRDRMAPDAPRTMSMPRMPDGPGDCLA